MENRDHSIKMSEKLFTDITKKGYFVTFRLPNLSFFKANGIFIQIGTLLQPFDFSWCKQQFPLNHTILVEGKWECVCT